MLIFLRYLKLSVTSVLLTGAIAHAAGNGSGSGAFLDGQLVGGNGGGADIVGGFGGGVLSLPAALPPVDNNGGKGVSSPAHPNGGGEGGTSVIIDQSNPNLPPRGTSNSWDGEAIVGVKGSGGGGGGVGAIINLSSFTLNRTVVGGLGGSGSGTAGGLDGTPARGSGGGGVGVVFNGQDLYIPEGMGVFGGAGGSAADSPININGQFKDIASGGGGLGLLLNTGTVHNNGIIQGGIGMLVDNPDMSAQGGRWYLYAVRYGAE